jgi:DNA-3-methyladenine glycosylase
MEQKAQVAKLPGRLIPRSFFEHAPERVAPLLLGKLLLHRSQAGVVMGRIIEVEAYLGPHNNPPDPAAHTYRGLTPRNAVIFGPPGHAYVYSIYGQYFCMNITCEIEGLAGCVLLRALEPVAGLDIMTRNRRLSPGASHQALTSGPGRLCQALGLTRLLHNGLDLTKPDSPLQLRDDACPVPQSLVTVRIGIKDAIDWPLRFVVQDHVCASGPKSLNRRMRPAR